VEAVEEEALDIEAEAETVGAEIEAATAGLQAEGQTDLVHQVITGNVRETEDL